MNPAHSTAYTAARDRRRSQRHYFDRQMPAEVVYGQHRLAIESGWIGNISTQGLGLRASKPVRLALGAPITVAAPRGGEVVTVHGKLVSLRHGTELGIEVAARDGQTALNTLGHDVKRVAVSNPAKGRTRISGKISLAARHPIQWAIQSGASTLDMSGATELDSAGLGLLLILNERHSLKIEKCPPQICRLIALARIGTVCAADCAQRGKP
ncbi:MAG: hypothetical protein Q7U97_02510 [Rhodocyclaceae bacterium]|nr:hypothetical protein [Rhodocyclaceae bacterium]